MKMINVIITNELKPYEADIRDLCLAFFPYQKINFVATSVWASSTSLDVGASYTSPEDIIIENYFIGTLTDNRTTNKSEIKRQLYNYLSEKTGKKLLWGTLTGIRPVTIVTNLIENQNTVGAKLCEPLKQYLKKEYYISDVKANKLIAIANKEISILKRDEVCDYKNRYSIYIGVPFCKSTCLYCSFTSFNIEKFGTYVDKYLDALERELENVVNDDNNKLKPLTLYVGGGTPTSLDEKTFERFLKIIDKYIDTKSAIEYTIEAGRPDTITETKLKLMKDFGVSRISINPQTFNQKTLDLIGRKHTTNDIIEKYNIARKIGFDNINMDIILGLPNEKILEVLNTLFNIYKLRPDSLTVHSLALKRAARLNYELNDWTKNYYLAGLADVNKTEGNREIDKMYKLSEMLAGVLKLEPYYLYI